MGTVFLTNLATVAGIRTIWRFVRHIGFRDPQPFTFKKLRLLKTLKITPTKCVSRYKHYNLNDWNDTRIVSRIQQSLADLAAFNSPLLKLIVILYSNLASIMPQENSLEPGVFSWYKRISNFEWCKWRW